MARQSYWLTSASLPRFPKLRQDGAVDVVIIGGGITGITAAYLLKKAGRSVALLERGRCARADTGHTTAHLTYVTDTRLSVLAKTFGTAHAQAAWDAGRAAMAQMRALVDEAPIACGYATVPGYLHAPWHQPDTAETSWLQAEAALAADLGFDAQYLASIPFAQRPGIRFANQARVHPRRYLAGLLSRIAGEGSHVYEHTEVTACQDAPLAVQANGHTIQCDYLIIATHVPLMGTTGLVRATLFQTKLASYSSYAIGAHVPKGLVPDALFWDTADPYTYVRVERRPRSDYVIIGGEDHKTGQETDVTACGQRLTDRLAALVPQAQVQAQWTGQVIATPDGLPYIGETAERQFVATGFAGNGLTFGTLGAMMATDAALGKPNPWRALFDVHRTTLTSMWDYLKENLDYPYYYLKDTLAAAEGTSLEALQRGEGKILRLGGQRVACYRNTQGNVTTLSPVCTHLGCLVHWNQADATWECPCHGSRFQATGAVLAGPAETPLEPVVLPKATA